MQLKVVLLCISLSFSLLAQDKTDKSSSFSKRCVQSLSQLASDFKENFFLKRAVLNNLNKYLKRQNKDLVDLSSVKTSIVSQLENAFIVQFGDALLFSKIVDLSTKSMKDVSLNGDIFISMKKFSSDHFLVVTAQKDKSKKYVTIINGDSVKEKDYAIDFDESILETSIDGHKVIAFDKKIIAYGQKKQPSAANEEARALANKVRENLDQDSLLAPYVHAAHDPHTSFGLIVRELSQMSHRILNIDEVIINDIHLLKVDFAKNGELDTQDFDQTIFYHTKSYDLFHVAIANLPQRILPIKVGAEQGLLSIIEKEKSPGSLRLSIASASQNLKDTMTEIDDILIDSIEVDQVINGHHIFKARRYSDKSETKFVIFPEGLKTFIKKYSDEEATTHDEVYALINDTVNVEYVDESKQLAFFTQDVDEQKIAMITFPQPKNMINEGDMSYSTFKMYAKNIKVSKGHPLLPDELQERFISIVGKRISDSTGRNPEVTYLFDTESKTMISFSYFERVLKADNGIHKGYIFVGYGQTKSTRLYDFIPFNFTIHPFANQFFTLDKQDHGFISISPNKNYDFIDSRKFSDETVVYNIIDTLHSGIKSTAEHFNKGVEFDFFAEDDSILSLTFRSEKGVDKTFLIPVRRLEKEIVPTELLMDAKLIELNREGVDQPKKLLIGKRESDSKQLFWKTDKDSHAVDSNPRTALCVYSRDDLKCDELDFTVTDVVQNEMPHRYEIIMKGQAINDFGNNSPSEAKVVIDEYGMDIKYQLSNYQGDSKDLSDSLRAMWTKRNSDVYPSLYVYNKDRDSYTEIDLAINTVQESDEMPDLFSMIFQASMKKKVESFRNPNDISEVDLVGNHLYVKTQTSPDFPETTYIYNLKNKEVEFALPNLKRILHVDKYIFYVSHPSRLNNAMVAVLNKETMNFVKSFDFGEIKLRIDDDAISIDGDLITFHTDSGVKRIYDLKSQSFLGMLSQDEMQLFEKLEEDSGYVLNNSVFKTNYVPLYNRDEFMSDFERSFHVSTNEQGSVTTLITGEDSVGKNHAVMEYISRYISGQLEPAPEMRTVFFKLVPNKMESGTKYVGEFEKKAEEIKKVSSQLAAKGVRLVVVMTNLHEIPDLIPSQGKGRKSSVFTILSDLIETDKVDFIGTTTPNGKALLERHQSVLMNRISNMRVLPPMSKVETIDSVNEFLVEQYPNMDIISASDLQKLVSRIEALSNNKALPGIAFETLRKTIRDVKGSKEGLERIANQQTLLKNKDIDKMIADITGIPAILIEPNEEVLLQTFRNLIKEVNSIVKDQGEAVEKSLMKIFNFADGLNRGDWPISKFFFVGPTGVGKTLLVETLCEKIMGSKNAFLKIDGAMFSRASGQPTAKLIEMIVNHIKDYPFNFILFDEFEKMSDEAQTVILGLLDGSITDINGNSISSSLSNIFATSNEGVEEFKALVANKAIGFKNVEARKISKKEMEAIYISAIKKSFRPEVTNRWDDLIVFNQLAQFVMEELVNDYLRTKIIPRFEAKSIQVEFDEALRNYITKHYYDSEYGSRHTAKKLENEFVGALGRFRLNGLMKSGEKYVISYDEEKAEIIIKK